MRTEEKNGKLIIFPKGRIDAENAQKFYDEVAETVAGRDPKTFELNLEDLAYISSAGLRSLLRLKKEGRDFAITEASPAVYDIFSVTGFTEMFHVRKALRQMSVDGCEVIGRGFYGTVYRVDDDTIVKVYDSPDSIPMIENEQRLAKQAFVKGVPTAISFDMVRIGERYGSVFELLNAKNFNDIMIEEPDRRDQTIRTYVEFLKKVHSTEMDADSVPSASQLFLQHLDTIKPHLTEEQHRILRSYLEAFPEDYHLVHGDPHLKNIMLVRDEPMLIDMDTLSAGHPIFDLAGLYVTYKAFEEDDPNNGMMFLGIDNDVCAKIWEGIMAYYFDGLSEEEKALTERKIRLAAAIRFLFLLEITGLKDEDLGPIRIRHTQEHIRELMEQTDGLFFPVDR